MKINQIKTISLMIAIIMVITSMFTAVAFLSDEDISVEHEYDKADKENNLVFGEFVANPDINVTKYVKNGEFGTYDDISVNASVYDTIFFWIEVENTGNTILDVIVDDYLPSGLEYIFYESPSVENNSLVDGIPCEPTFRQGNDSFYWKFDDIQFGQIINITFKVKVVSAGELENSANVTGIYRDECIKVHDTASVIAEECLPGVEVEKYVWNGSAWTEYTSVYFGGNVYFKVIIYNPSDCYSMHFSGVVFDQLPDNLRYINQSSTIYPEGHPGHPDGPGHPDPDLYFEYYDWENNTVYWNKPYDIMPNENLTFYYNATAVDCGLGVNNLTVHPEGFTPVGYPGEEVSNLDHSYDVSDNATVFVICGEPNISVEKSVKYNCDCQYDPEGINISGDDWVTFKINVTNTGTVALDITVNDTLPDGLVYNNNAEVDGTPQEPDVVLADTYYIWYLYDVQPGESVEITFEATVATDECGKLTNVVNVKGDSEYFDDVFDEDDAYVFVSCPGIDIVKDVDKPLIHAGDVVVYTYAVMNAGNSPLTNVVVMDDQGLVPVYVSGDDDLDGLLDVDEIWVYNASASLMDDVINVGNVTAEDEHGTGVYAEDNASVDVISPCISVVKTVSPCCVDPEGDATWNITVENTGDVTLTDVYVVDDNMGALAGMLTLAPGEKLYYEYVTNPVEGTTNTVDVNGTDPLGLEVTDSDSATVEICELDIDFDLEKIVKWNCQDPTYGDYTYSHVDDWVTFNITITNTGEVPINLTVCDILPEELLFFGQPTVDGVVVYPVDMCWTINDLAPGEMTRILFKAIVEECGEHVNTVIVTAVYDGYDPVVKQDNATVIAICPDIEVEKTADSNVVCNGEEVTYTYRVNNTGNHYLKDVTLSDDEIPLVSYVSGDTNTDGRLDVDETWIYTATTVLCENTTNTVEVSAKDELGRMVTDQDTEFVEVIDCQNPPELSIEVEKTVKKNCCGDYFDSIFAHQNDWVTFNISVENTGEEILDVTVVDTLPAGLSYDDSCYVDGGSFTPDVDGQVVTFDIGPVNPDVTVVITFRATVDCQVCGSLVNNVSVNGSFEDYSEVVDEDSAEVFVLCPDIEIVKTANPTTIEPGEEVTYTYTVTNEGNCPLENVVVTDDQGLVPVLISGDDGDGILQTSETWVYENVTHVFVDTTNTGTVTAEDELGKQVSDEDDAFVNVDECGCITDISIDKKIYYDGEWSDNLDVQTNEDHINVTFKITVENTGTCDLENISIIDTYECGIENPRDFTGDFTEYEIISDQIFFSVDEPFTSEADPIIIMFNATIYTSTINHVEVLADSTYDETHVCKYDSVTIELNDETPVNHEPYKPVDPNPENLEENVSINPILSVYIEDPDGDTLSVSFYNETDVLLGTVDDVASGTLAELFLSALEHETWYSWYAIVSDGEYTNTSDVFSFKTKKDTGLDPTVKITTPETGSIYFRGIHITASFLENALVIGGINITVDADDADGEITNIDFIIDGEIKKSTTNTYYYWNEICFGWYTILVRVTDDMGNTAEDTIDVFMLNRGI